jgi:NADPH-dependent 2,4-dienoyl-CoA reductase/sulfur reductase-like enzyme
MFRRTRALRDPVTFTLDGETIAAERGEPIAVALLGDDKTILARSPKLHRPRGPSCLRGGCDGCLARVDGVPNVMTCLRPAQGGEVIVSQNVIGSRKADLMRVTDWFFAQGIDHHHLMAGVPGLSDVMQTFARKVAGLGRLPTAVEAVKPARRIEVDVAIVGAGLAGIVIASRLVAAGKSVILVDDGLTIGGSLLASPKLLAETLAAYPTDGVEIHTGSVAAGYFFGDLLVAAPEGAIVVRPRATVFATGVHDGVLSIPNNDLPGIFSARALARVVHAGVLPDGPVAIVGEGFWADEVAAALEAHATLRFTAAEVIAAHGTAGVKTLEVRDGKGTRKAEVGAVALALRGAPAFELAEQAGAATRFDPESGYAVVTGPSGRIAETLWAAGECTGKAFDPGMIRAEAKAVAASVLAALTPR